MNDDDLITLKDASEIIFGGRISPRYLKGEVGVTMGGWRFGETVLTSLYYAKEFRDSIRVISTEPIKGPGVYIVGYAQYVKIGVSTKVNDATRCNSECDGWLIKSRNGEKRSMKNARWAMADAMSDDIVERLRDDFLRGEITLWNTLPEAADEIERLREDNRRLRSWSWVSSCLGG